MSGPFGSSQFMYATGALAEGSSLRFEDGDSAYLSFTPASAGNRKTWTWSGWVKRGNLGSSVARIFNANDAGSPFRQTSLRLDTDQLRFYSDATGVTTDVKSSAVYRDASAWYHIVLSIDTTQATASNRVKMYVNSEQITSLATSTYPSQNLDMYVNEARSHQIGASVTPSQHFDGYIANVAFIDGQALTPTSFGEYEDTLWKPKSDTDIQALTFGTNGFYLPFDQTTEAEGFSTVTYTGNGSTHGIEGVGFEPDLVWLKSRSAYSHNLSDSVRGGGVGLSSNSTAAEYSISPANTFDSDGFTLNKTNNQYNASGVNYVAWCWDAGTGSAVSNTDGSITSSVKANTTNGFSIVSYTGNGTNGATVGHGLNQAPDLWITKNRSSGTADWLIKTSSMASNEWLRFKTDALLTNLTNNSANSTVITTGGNTVDGKSGDSYVCYAFHSVSGYSSIGSYTGTGAAGNSITGLGFKPAFVMIKDSTNSGNSWVILDNTRDTTDPRESGLFPDGSYAEADLTTGYISSFDADGFTVAGSGGAINTSGATMIYMAFADTRDATFFGDTSGNGNNWTPNALNNTDVVPDSPVTNFATLNALTYSGAYALTLSEGNLVAREATGNATWKSLWSTFAAPTSGKWYAEFYLTYTGATGFTYQAFAGLHDGLAATTYIGQSSGSYGYIASGGTYNNATHTTSYGASYGSGDIIGVAWDADNGDLTFYKNGVSQGTAYSSVSAENKFFGVSAFWVSPDGQTFWHCNFGQDSSFAGNKTPQGNTDDNGQGDFYYAPPSGFLALTRNNLPAPDILDPADYFNTVLWTGDNTNGRSITGVGFQPDFTWFKARSGAVSHQLYDFVRGAGVNKELESNNTNAEGGSNTEIYGYLSSIDSDGLTFASGTDPSFPNVYTNDSRYTYAAWNWLAGGTAVSNTDGSITSQVSANTDAGFSVVGWTGTGAVGTLGHGLGAEPYFIVVKARSVAGEAWYCYHKTLGNGARVQLNETSAVTNGSSVWNTTTPTSSVFSIGNGNPNTSGATYIAYCFAEVEGYSKIGSYTGNGSTDGTYVHLGFRPSWVMVKRTDAGPSNWTIIDNKRDDVNVSDAVIYPHLSNAEGTQSATDMLSNGFKLRHSTSEQNGSGATYIFMAFAEAPFKNANAR